MEAPLLTREQFKGAVFYRDGYKCVLCGAMGVDAHHIIDRKLWPDGGYYLDNGVTLCEQCHYNAETSTEPKYSPDGLRLVAGIAVALLPPGLIPGLEYDKWGNTPFIPDEREKYPHTPHLPWSPGYDAKEDMVLQSVDHWAGTRVVITEKMDGENTTMYRMCSHARSPDGRPHPSRTRARAIWGRVRYDIPIGWRICGENVSAVHSIKYYDLAGYYLVFSIWNGDNALTWDDTKEWCQLLGLPTVPVLYHGLWDEAVCNEIISGLDLQRQEGIVVRPEGTFGSEQIASKTGVMGKWVRKGHVTTDEHWMDKPVEWNMLQEGIRAL